MGNKRGEGRGVDVREEGHTYMTVLIANSS